MSDSAHLMAATLLAKRKRPQVSYLDEDDERDEALDFPDDNAASQVPEDDTDGDDTTYGSRKKAHHKSKKAKAGANKRARMSKVAKTQKPFPFMALPAELRDQIYELALVDPDGVSLVSKTKKYRRIVARGPIHNADDGSWSYGRRRRRHPQQTPQEADFDPAIEHNELSPALLAVSRQIHGETLGYLYQQPIILEDTYALHSFLASLSTKNLSLLTDITVKGWGGGRGTHKAMNFCSLTLLASCTNLKSLNLDCGVGWGRSPKGLARQLYRDGFHFFEAYGAANGSKDAAVDVLELSKTNYDSSNYSWYRRHQADLEKEEFERQFRAELRRLIGC